MGLFSGSKKYVAYAGSSELFDDLPGSFKNNIVQSTISNSSKPGAVLHTIFTDQHARVKSMMRYAARYDDPTKEGGYVRGFPTSNMSVITINPSAVEEALGRAVGAYDSITSSKAGPYSETFFLSSLVQADWPEWDENDTEVTLPDATIAPNPPEFSRVADVEFPEDGLYIPPLYTGKYVALWTSPTSTHSLDLDLGPYMGSLYVMVKYVIGTRTHYWHYEIDSGLDPAFESAIDEEEQSGEFLPVAILMQDRIWFDESDRDGTPAPDTELAITTNKLMKKFATSGTDIKEDFQAQEAEDDASGDDNKSNAKKWDFFIHFATHIDTQVRGAKEYLWEFFTDLEAFTTNTSADYYTYLASETGGDRYTKAQPISELNITEGNVNGYNVNYRWSFIETREFSGEWLIDDPLADVTPRPLKPKEIANEQWQRSDVAGEQKAEYQSRLDDFFGGPVQIGLYDPNHKKNADNKDWERYGYHDYVILTKQMDVAEGAPPKYQQTIVMGLSMQYVINTKDGTGAKGYNFRYATPHMFGLDTETKEFRIPLQWGALQRVPVLHREETVSEAMCGTVFLVEVVKTAWYQTGFFKWLLIIIAIVLMVISIWFPPLITAAVGVLGAALGGGALALFFAYVIINFAIGYLIALGTSLMSPNMQMIFAVVIIVAMIYTGQFANLKGSISSFTSAPGWGTAATMINAIGPVYNMGFSVYNQYTIGKYEDEFRDLVKDQRERQQELEDAWDLFGPVPSYIDPLELQSSFDRAGSSEQASSYFARVLEPNPGVLGYALVTEWAGNALTLPKEQGPTLIEGMMSDFEQQRG